MKVFIASILVLLPVLGACTKKDSAGKTIGKEVFVTTMPVGGEVNIAPLEEGFFYEAWLVQEGENDVSVGHLTNPSGDVRHQLRFTAEEDYRSRAALAITREPDDGNSEPGSIVARAMLKKRER